MPIDFHRIAMTDFSRGFQFTENRADIVWRRFSDAGKTSEPFSIVADATSIALTAKPWV